MTGERSGSRGAPSIWLFAFGYFACYAPYSALTKALSKGLLEKMDRSLPSFEVLPVSVMASVVGMFTFLTIIGWWKHASRWTLFGIDLPRPTFWTFLSGLCTGAIIATTTLAYTFTGVSIVFVMLLMRGGVLIIAPIVDAISGRHVRWFSWTSLGLTLAALFVAFSEEGGYSISLICAIDIAVYLASYFVRLRFMSRLAKSEDPDANKRFFVEEQMIASPSLLFALLIAGTLGFSLHPHGALAEIHAGFTTFWSGPVVGETIVIGLLSQGTGIFGGLILLDKRENTYCVPVNRASSILAGVLASYGLTIFFGQATPSAYKLGGAGLIITAILFLSIPPLLASRRA